MKLEVVPLTLREARAFVARKHRHHREPQGGQSGGGSWSRESRPRVDLHPLQEKLRWEAA